MARYGVCHATGTGIGAVISARDTLATAEKAYADAYTAAERTGCTADELRKVGLDAPTHRRPGRSDSTGSTTNAASMAKAAVPNAADDEPMTNQPPADG